MVRKFGHVSEYAILALLVLRALDSSRGERRAGGWTIAICAAYAATDEFHQSFVVSRTAAGSDVLLDTVGAGIGVGLAVWLRCRFSWDRRSPA